MRDSNMNKWRGRLMQLTLPMAVVLLLGYTADQLLTGERGIVTWRMMQDQVQSLKDRNEKTIHDVETLTSRVARLKPDANGKLDEDYVDELIRTSLPLLKSGEELVLVTPTNAD